MANKDDRVETKELENKMTELKKRHNNSLLTEVCVELVFRLTALEVKIERLEKSPKKRA